MYGFFKVGELSSRGRQHGFADEAGVDNFRNAQRVVDDPLLVQRRDPLVMPVLRENHAGNHQLAKVGAEHRATRLTAKATLSVRRFRMGRRATFRAEPVVCSQLFRRRGIRARARRRLE